MTWILPGIIIAVSAIIIFLGLFLGKKLSGGRAADKIGGLKEEAQNLEKSLLSMSSATNTVASQAQLDFVSTQSVELVTSLEKQKALLKEIESKLDTAQKDVEQKESAQQEMKSAKEEDEARLIELSGQFEQISSASVSLEQELSQSLKSLDIMMAEVPMSADQRAVFQDLSNTMTAASSRLRDLITDYQAVNERLQNLQSQHTDLEEEYTKLVEQQLGA